MSKSKNNGIDPQEMVDKYGADTIDPQEMVDKYGADTVRLSMPQHSLGIKKHFVVTFTKPSPK